MEKRIRKLVVGAAVACGVTAGACGGSSGPSSPSQGPPSTPPLTQAQIVSLESAFTSVENSPLTKQFIIQVLNEDNSPTITSVPVNVSQACSDGGTAGLTGTVNQNVGQTGGTSSLNANLTITFSKCTSNGVELDGTLSSSGQITANNTNTSAAVVVNPVTFTLTGSSTFILNGVTGTSAFSCSNSVNVNVQAGTLSGITSSGNATLQYPTGQNTTTVPCSGFSAGFQAPTS
jgi:hypothetical protein